MLDFKCICRSFDDVLVPSEINLHLERRGLVHTLKGGNGSGNATLINVLSGFLPLTKGAIAFKEKKIAKFTPYSVNRLGIGRTFQVLRLSKPATVYEKKTLMLKINFPFFAVN